MIHNTRLFLQMFLVRFLLFLCTCTLFFSCKNENPKAGKSTSYYQEQHRPQFHFSPEANWMNDPNGMVFFEGEYHLFYQYYPDSTVWGPMHWGHAVSTDLVSWEHLPIALYPDSLGYIFSGSAVVDWKNTTGFSENGNPPLIAIFTHHSMEGEQAGRSDFQYQSIAYSTDKGRTWTKYAGNPVLPNAEGIRDFRDPKVIWDEAHDQWLMVFAAQNKVKFWASKDLKSWKYLSDFGEKHGSHAGVWECPDFFPSQIESGDTFWVLLLSINPGGPNGGSATQYFVGHWDGTHFTLDTDFEKKVNRVGEEEQAVWLDYGRDNYAGVTWSDIPSSDGRRIFMGWMSNWNYAQQVPTERWRSAMTIPRFLMLQNDNSDLYLTSNPVHEIYSLRNKKFIWNATDYIGKVNLTESTSIDTRECHLYVEFEADATAEIAIVLENSKGERYRVGYDAQTRTFFSDRRNAGKVDFGKNFADAIHTAPRITTSKKVILELFIDRASCELFADGGRVNMTDIFFPTEDFDVLSFEVKNGGLLGNTRVVVSDMNSIWQ